MHTKLRTTYKINITRDRVMIMLKELDPEGTERRKSRRLNRRVYRCPGPDAVWHLDGYDKLKPYGLPIHGCVDGFSRKILWLNVCKSNNNPYIPAKYFIRQIKDGLKAPTNVRTDHGTENGILAAMQCTLTNANSHTYGKSIANQRIENWWSHQRRCYTDWLISYFKEMVYEGIIETGNIIHQECVWFVYSGLLQSDLEDVKNEWNDHCIRKSVYSVVSGIPNQLYFLPETKGFEHQGVPVSEQVIETLEDHTEVNRRAEEGEQVTDEDLIDYFEYIISELDLEYPPKDWMRARLMYYTIISHL